MNSFEDNMKELEAIVNSLESGKASLDECVSLFENGVKLTDECVKMLNDAEQKIKILVEDKNGNVTEEDFEEKSEQ